MAKDYLIPPNTNNGIEIGKFYKKICQHLNVILNGYLYGPSAVTDGAALAFDGTSGQFVKADTRLTANLTAGPSSATDNAVARFNGDGGKTLQNSGVTIDDSGNLILPADLYRVSWQTYTPTFAGFNPATPDNFAYAYTVAIGKMVFLWFNFNGNSSHNYMRMSLPINAAGFDFVGTCQGLDNSAYITSTYAIIKNTDATTVHFCAGTLSGDESWTTSNDKGAIGYLWYRAT